MSQIILDDQLFDLEVLVPIARWITVQRLRDLRPGEVIKDERVPALLRQLPRPTFVTIDNLTLLDLTSPLPPGPLPLSAAERGRGLGDGVRSTLVAIYVNLTMSR